MCKLFSQATLKVPVDFTFRFEPLCKYIPGRRTGHEVARHERRQGRHAPREEHRYVGREDRREDAVRLAQRVPDAVQFLPEKGLLCR